MKNLFALIVVIVALLVAPFATQAQCGGHSFIQGGQAFIQQGGLQCINGVCFQQQQVVIPQSLGFFAASQPTFISRQFVSQPVVFNRAAVVAPRVQRTVVRNRGNVQRVRTVNRGVAINSRQTIIVR